MAEIIKSDKKYQNNFIVEILRLGFDVNKMTKSWDINLEIFVYETYNNSVT